MHSSEAKTADTKKTADIRAAADGHAITELKPSHHDRALELLNNEGWDYRSRDLERLERIAPGGNLVVLAEKDRPVGLLTALSFPPLGLIGNVVSDPDHRGRGVARVLVRSGVARLKAKGCTTQRLFSYPHTAGLYRRLGFEAVGVTSTLRLTLEALDPRPGAQPYQADLLEELLALDRRLVGYDRSALLRVLLAEGGEQTLVSRNRVGELDGYILASGRPDPEVKVDYELGPWVVAKGCVNWRALLEGLLARLEPGATLELSAIADQQRVLGLCRRLGFSEAFSTLDMQLGPPLPGWSEQNVLARAGLVKG